MRPLSLTDPEKLQAARSLVEQYLTQTCIQDPGVEKKPLTIRSIGKRLGVSRSLIGRLAVEARREREASACSALRLKFGSKPLDVGVGLKMMSADWRAQEATKAIAERGLIDL